MGRRSATHFLAEFLYFINGIFIASIGGADKPERTKKAFREKFSRKR